MHLHYQSSRDFQDSNTIQHTLGCHALEEWTVTSPPVFAAWSQSERRYTGSDAQ
ncbi:hypothetical protein OG21DRAFT_1507614 [Imleria badia]|nr:hypothetical protein OG21DRAFT_1507614 [Imleria badia]